MFLGRKQWFVLLPGEEKKVEVGPATFVYDLLSEESRHLQVSGNVSCYPFIKDLYPDPTFQVIS